MSAGQNDASSAAAVCAALGMSPVPDVWQASWDRSQDAYKPGAVPFLQREFVEAQCRWVGMQPDVTEVFVAALPGISSNPCLERLAWHCHWLLFISDQDARAGDWPRPGEAAGEAGRMLYAVTLLSGVPHVRALHEQRGVDEAITLDTLADLELWVREYKGQYDAWGFKQTGWLSSHLTGALYKLGRLQYLPGTFHHPFRVYRHAQSRQGVMLAESGCVFRADGQFANADNGVLADAEGKWTTDLQVTDAEIRGTPVDPHGYARREPMALAASEWEEILRKGDPVLTVHIPATGSMKHDDCGASFRQAVDFYAKHFPEVAYKAFTCVSWLLDPQLADNLPAKSNIVRFLQEWYLHPAEAASDGQTLERVFGFGVKEIDPNTAPQETSLQKAIVQHMQAGKRWRSGGSLLFAEDLNWGQQAYWTQGLPA